MVVLLALPGYAQTVKQRQDIGPVALTWGLPGSFSGNTLYLPGGVHMAATNYDLQAQSVTVTLQTGGGYGITRAVALGDAAKHRPVIGRFSSLALARTYIIQGDKAIYVPVPGRKDGGQIDFTGNVVITLQAPQALDGPAVTHVSLATVQVGAGPDYPKVDFGPGTLTFTPLQGK